MDSSEGSPSSNPHRRPGTAALVGGILLLIGWLIASAVWFFLSMMGGLMANDSGAVSEGTHSGLLLGLVIGQILTTLAGILGSTGLFWPARRKWLMLSGVGMLVAGIAIQVIAFQNFAAAAAAA